MAQRRVGAMTETLLEQGRVGVVARLGLTWYREGRGDGQTETHVVQRRVGAMARLRLLCGVH